MKINYIEDMELKNYKVNDDLAMKFPKDLAFKYRLLVLDLIEGKLIAVASENNTIYKELLEMYYDYDVLLYLGNESIIYEKINLLYFIDLNKNLFLDREKVKESHIVNLINRIIAKGIGLKATDIHFEPYENISRVRYRINGELVFSKEILNKDYKELVSRLKLISKLDISETRLPQDGRLNLNIDQFEVDIRVATIPNIFGEKIVLRILDKNKFNFKLGSIGLGRTSVEALKNIIRQPHGMVLISGPSGSGKTTSLYTMIKELNMVNKNIITIEDPIEYTIEGINQSQVNEKVGYNFELGLKAILRQDPDIIMIGEIREEVVSKLALKSAIFGHLVFSTIHTSSSISTIFRLLSMDIEKYLIATGLISIISQRLVRVLCSKCKKKRLVKEEEKSLLKLKETYYIYDAIGCGSCIEGYVGRIPIMEIINIDQDFKELINRSSYIGDYENLVIKKKIRTLEDEARDLVLNGKISIEEFLKVVISL